MAALGIVVYRFESDGFFYGRFPDTKRKFDEVAKKADGKDTIEGYYVCSYIDANNKLHTGEMTITENEGIYHFYKYAFSKESGQQYFRGIAVQKNADEITVLFS